MFTTNNNFKVFVQNTKVGNNVTGADLSSIVAGTIIPIGDNDIALDNDGQTIVQSPNSTSLSTFKFAQKTSTGITHFSDNFKVKDIIGISFAPYLAPVEQVSYVGYNGTSGAINAIDYNEYILSLIYKHDDMMWSEQINIKPYLVTTESGAVASTVASQFAKLINNDTYSKVVAEVVCSATTVATSGGAFTVTKGSDTVTTVESSGSAGDAGKYNSDGSTLVAGDYIRFGHTTTKTYPVYRIVSITGGGSAAATIVLDRPYAGTSGSISAANTGAVASATGVASDFGLKITGIELDWASKGVFPYKQVAFDLTLKGFGSTTQSTTAATYPMGYYKQVSDLEWFSQFGSDGLRNATQHPVPTGRSETSSSVNYHCWTIRYKGSAENDPIVGQSNLTSTIYLFAPSDDAGASTDNPTNDTVYTFIHTNIIAPLATLAGVTIQ